MQKSLVIAGPTASGKSSLALQLTDRLDGEIVNADAIQVYHDLRILTARPSVTDEAAVPHHLYGVSPGDDPWSAGRYARAAADVIAEITSRGKRPIIVGGTGLWLKALTEGLSPMPDVPEEVMAKGEARLAEMGMTTFREEVLVADPAMAKLEPQDRQRHLRAWTVFAATGRALSDWQAAPPVKVVEGDFLCGALVPPREDSREVVATRLEEMVAAGALDEVRDLLAKDYPARVPVMKAVGVPEFAAHLHGDISLDDAIEKATTTTRQLVKRQTTWLRGQCQDWLQAETPEALMSALLA